MPLLDRLFSLVKGEPLRTGGYYASKLGNDVTRSEVNRCLYSSACFFNEGTERPAWRVVGKLPPIKDPWRRRQTTVFPAPVRLVKRTPSDEIPERISADVTRDLSGWQRRAYESWIHHKRRGVVEAVTGAGKTRLGITAIKEAMAMGRRSIVVTPSIALQQQWHRALKASFPNVKVGLFGGGHRQTTAAITIAVVNGLATDAARPNPQFRDVYLLVADEVHRYGAPNFARALLPSAAVRLGLTATLERTDDGVKEVLLPYFGASVYTCDFRQARVDGRLAPAFIALLGIAFNADEQEAYDDAERKKRDAWSKLVHEHQEELSHAGFRNNDSALFFAAAQRLAEKGDEAGMLARTWMRTRSDASDILANATGKRSAATNLSPLFGGGHSGIVFCQRIAAADQLSTLFARQGLRSAAFHSEVQGDERGDMLRKLKDGRLEILTTATALDEGIDVPDIDTGIIISSTQQRRQMIQRLGRVLRAKPDGRPARVVIIYALGTWEDPAANDRRAEFAQFAAAAAGKSDACRDFKRDWDIETVRAFFAQDFSDNSSGPLRSS